MPLAPTYAAGWVVDLCRTLGGRGDEARLRSDEAMTLTCDLGWALIDGTNDRLSDARELAELLSETRQPATSKPVAELTGVPTEAFYRSTASVAGGRHQVAPRAGVNQVA